MLILLLVPLLVAYLVAYWIWSWLNWYNRLSPSTLKGRAVLISGCDSGLGRLTARKFYEAGFKVFANVYLEESIESLKKEFSDLAHPSTSEIIPLKFDVSDEKQAKAAYQTVQKEAPEGLWGLINNAGILEGYFIEFTSVETYQRVLNVNFFGVVNMTKTFLPLVKKAKGRIVTITSIAGRFSPNSLSAYSASKFASESFCDGLRLELKPFGVKVAIIEPGGMKTPMIQKAVAAMRKALDDNPELTEEYIKMNPNFKNQQDQLEVAKIGEPTPVAEAIIHAVTGKYPKTRYLVGTDARIVSVLALLPASFMDWLMRQADRPKKK